MSAAVWYLFSYHLVTKKAPGGSTPLFKLSRVETRSVERALPVDDGVE